MLNLNLTTDKLQVITSSGADCDVLVTFVDTDTTVTTASSVVPGRKVTAITTATTSDITDVPASSHVISVQSINIRNIDASVSNDVTVQFNANTVLYTLMKCTLAAGEELTYQKGVWFHYDANGGVYGLGTVFAAQADMEAATSTTLVVTPGRQHFHPSAAKFWTIFTGNSTTITASYNMTSITDGTTQATVTIATDFSTGAWCVLTTAVAAAATVTGARLASCLTLASGSVIVFCVDAIATQGVVDPTSWCVAGWGDQ